MKHDMSPYPTIDLPRSVHGPLLANILLAINDADATASRHFERSRAGDNLDSCAQAADDADDRASRGRALARHMIETAFPGVTWPMIERAGL